MLYLYLDKKRETFHLDQSLYESNQESYLINFNNRFNGCLKCTSFINSEILCPTSSLLSHTLFPLIFQLDMSTELKSSQNSQQVPLLYTKERLLKLYGVDLFAAVSSAAMVSPFIAVVDR